MRLLGSHEEGEASDEQTCAEAAGGTVETTKRDRSREEGDQQLPPEDNSGSESESGAETDDEASSASDYPPHLTGQPAGVATSLLKGHETRLLEYDDGGERDAPLPRCSGRDDSRYEEKTEELSHLESSSVEASAACPSITISFQGASGTSPSFPTIQLPQTQGSSGDESNGGNEPDISASVSESEGAGLHPQSSDNLPCGARVCDSLLKLPSRTAHSHGGDHRSNLKPSESESESSPTELVEDELEDLSLKNKLHQPHRDEDRDQLLKDGKSESLSTATTSPPISTNTYLYGENASDRVRHLVKRSISKKRKQQQRQSRPKRETKTPLARGRRSKKSNRNSMKHGVDATLF